MIFYTQYPEWEAIAMKFQERGYSRSTKQHKTGMHNLQQKYKNVKTLNNTSRQGKNSFPFNEEIDKMLGLKPNKSTVWPEFRDHNF